jgi:hypothetical protein
MPITLNKKFIVELQQLYDNYMETYNGIYVNDWITGSASAAVPWSSIAVNESTGHMIAVSNNNTNTVANNFAYSDNGGLIWINFNNSTTPSSNSNSAWKGVAFGNDIFVGISSSGTTTNVSKIFFSNKIKPITTNDFSYINNTNNNNWEVITYGNGYFVAAASSGTNRVMTSKNGSTWSYFNSADSLAFKAITYSEKLKRFVAITNSGGAYSNYNGQSWATTTLPSGTWNSVIWSSKLNIFVMVGNSGVTATSSNGITWILSTLTILLTLTSVTWSQELEIFVAISNSTTLGTKKVITSIDGTNWIFRETSSLDATFSTIIWNRFFGTFISLANGGTNRIILTRALGDNTLLERNNYLAPINDFLYNFNYTIPKLYTTVGKSNKIYPIINESRRFNFSIFNDEIEDAINNLFPKGLTLDKNSGEIIGTPTVAQELTTYRIYAISEVDNRKIYSDLQILVANSEIEITNFNYSETSLIKDRSDNNIFLVPSYDSGTNISYSISPSAPTGLLLDVDSGIISGSLSTNFAETEYTITASNTLIGKNKTFKIKITSNVLNFKLRAEQIEIIDSSAIIEGRKEELFDYSLGYISKNSYCNKFYGKNKGLLSKNFFFDRNNNFLPNLIKSIITYYRIRKSTNTTYENFLILEIKGDLKTGNPVINWTKLIFRGNIFLKSTAEVFYDSSTDSTIYKFNQSFNPNFFQNELTEIIINNT